MNTTFTNYAEKKAKQFLNLLQGYTKGIRLTAILILLLMGVNNAWAVNHTGGYVYFLKPSTWTESTVMMFIGRDQWNNDYTTVFTMTKVTNTDNLYCYTMPKYDDANYVTFANASNAWGSGSWYSENRKNASHYTNVYKDYTFTANSYYVVVPASTSNDAGITINKKSSVSDLNLTTQANVYGSTDGGSTYASMGAAGTVSVSGYYMSSYNAVSTRSAVSSSASQAYASTTLAPGSTATFKATASTGYEFVGWFDAASGGTAVSTDATYTFKYDISYAGKTLYARFKQKQHTVLFGVHSSGHGSLTAKIGNTGISSNNKVNYGSEVVFTATPSTGYQIEGWYKNSDCTTSLGNGTNNTYTVTITGGTNVYVKFKAQEYTITYKDQGGSNFSGTHASGYPTTHTYGTATTLKDPTKDGYTFDGWFTNSDCTGTAIESLGATAYTAAITLYAKWTAITYTVTLDQEGAAVKGDASVRADYNDDMPKLSKLPTAPDGYAFMGYWDGKDGTGTQYYDAEGASARVWDKAGDAILYAYFKQAELTITLNKQTFDPGESSVVATPTIAPTPEGDVTIDWSLLYSSGSEVPNHTVNVDGEGRATFTISDLATGQYKIKAVLKTGNTELDIEYANFTIASNYTITVRYTCDGKDIAAATKMSAHVNQATEITAPEIGGYDFKEWVLGDGISSTSTLTEETISFNANYDGYLTATYQKKKLIFLDVSKLPNKDSWTAPHIYLYKDGYWDSDQGAGSGTHNTSPLIKEAAMTQVPGTTDIWYYEYAGVNNFNGIVAFTSVAQVGFGNFHGCEAIYRTDFTSGTPMYVPTTDQEPEKKNGNATSYYNKGYWAKYMDGTGYELRVYSQKDGDPTLVASIPFEYTTNEKMPMAATIDLEATRTYGFKVYRADEKYYGNSGTMTNSSHANWDFTEGASNCGLTTGVSGNYTFTLNYDESSKDKNDFEYRVTVEYPASVGDYRIIYKDNNEKNWSGNPKPDGWFHPSRIIKKAKDTKDIISFFIDPEATPTIQYQSITAVADNGNVTWNTGEDIELPEDIKEAGVYNLIFTQTESAINLEAVEPYTGNYYIRVDAVDGKWVNYTTDPDNRMSYSAFSESEANNFGDKFSHYKTEYVTNNTNIKFVIANDYSPCISDTLTKDIFNPLGNIDEHGVLLPNDIYNANIRFMWNRKTNKISRAYIGPAGDKQSQFLMLQSCSEFKDAAGNNLNSTEGDILDQAKNIYAARFTDTQNWIYERTLQVKPDTRVKLYASYPKGYHIYVENNTGWSEVALYAFKDGGDQPLGNWPGMRPVGTVVIEGKTYYDFPVKDYVFGSKLIFNNNVKENGQQTGELLVSTAGDYYLTASNDHKLSQTNYDATTVEAQAQYFRGAYAEGSCENEHTVEILGGNGDDWQTIRVIYDFKTNRLMRAWVPSGNISGDQAINADLMVIREHQKDATCITFANDESKLSQVKTVYGTIRFNRWTLNNRDNADDLSVESCTRDNNGHRVYDEKTTNDNHPILSPEKQVSIYARGLYFISFPFNVHLSDVFGFGQYGTHWVISTYNGLRRAQRGYFDQDCVNEDCSNWDYIWDPSDFKMEANVGYLLSIDLDLMRYDNTDFWTNNISTVELMFPSMAELETIQKTNYEMPELGEEYKCNINNTYDDRRVKDSYWRCIGVPSFADYSGVLKDGNDESITWQPEGNTFPFLYEWNTTDNSLMVQSTSNYKFRSTFAYLVQNGNAIRWSVVNAKPSQIVARQRSAEQESNYEWNIALLNGEKKEDQTFLRMSDLESVTTEFDFGQDLSKEFNYGRSEIYTLIGTNQVAANSLPLSDHTTVVSLGLDIDKAGDYTIAMPEGVMSVGVTLYDAETGTRTNLSAGMEYTIALNKGVCDNRLYLEISPIQNDAPTDIENIGDGVNNGETVKKYLIDGRLYLKKGCVLYDAQGRKL